MNPKEFERYLDRTGRELKRFIEVDLQDIVGTEGVNHFRQSFFDEGFMDATIDKWLPRSKKYGNDTKDGKAILTQTGDLGDSIQYQKTASGVEIFSDLPYAAIHNEGGTIKITVTPKLRKFAWAMWFESGKTNNMWRGLALTKNTEILVKVPKRQFVGDSEELDRKVMEKIERELDRIFEI